MAVSDHTMTANAAVRDKITLWLNCSFHWLDDPHGRLPDFV
jgi:hypothetical protein